MGRKLSRRTNENSKKKKQTAWSAGKREDQVAIDFSFESDWLRKWHEASGPITKRSKPNKEQVLDYFRQSIENCSTHGLFNRTYQAKTRTRIDILRQH